MLVAVAALLSCPQEPAIIVDNLAPVAREETVRVSVPLPRGKHRNLAGVAVDGRFAPAVPLVRWPDGSLAVVQLHARVAIAGSARRRIPLDLAAARTLASKPAGKPAGKPARDPGSWHLQGDLPLRLEVEDPWGTRYVAKFTAAVAERITATPLLRTVRYRSVLRKGRRRFFAATVFLTTFADSRRAEFTVRLENGVAGALPAAPVLGPARMRAVDLLVTDERLRIRPRFIAENHLRPPTRAAGEWRQPLLLATDQWYLGDRTAKVWRFDLFRDGDGVTAEQRRAAALAAEQPLVALPELAWVRHTRAFGVHGAVADGPGRPTPTTAFLVNQWRTGRDFGPFGGFGDPRDACVNGTPRNGPCALHNVLRFGSGKLLRAAEAMVLQGCLRPTPGYPVRLPAATGALRQRMSKRTLQRPHGFVPFDYEHASVDLLYDYYWLTGDPIALDELRRMGRGLRQLLKDLPFLTCRGEGWCMQAAVAIARATGDAAIVRELAQRFAATVLPKLAEEGADHVLAQPPHPDALDGREPFDCPWQMAAFVHGATAMWFQSGEVRFRDAALRAARAMAGPGWLRGTGPKYLVSATGSGRYSLPVGYGPMEGTALMQLGGFVLAETIAVEERDQTLFRQRATELFANYAKVSQARNGMNAWFQLHLDRGQGAR